MFDGENGATVGAQSIETLKNSVRLFFCRYFAMGIIGRSTYPAIELADVGERLPSP